MTRRTRLAKLEAQEQQRVTPEDQIGIYESDPEAGLWRDQQGRTRPMTAEEVAQATAALGSLQGAADGLGEGQEAARFRLKIGPLSRQPRSKR